MWILAANALSMAVCVVRHWWKQQIRGQISTEAPEQGKRWQAFSDVNERRRTAADR
jgi:hypothetical protein